MCWQMICKTEGILATSSVLATLSDRGENDIRYCVNALQLASKSSQLTIQSLNELMVYNHVDQARAAIHSFSRRLRRIVTMDTMKHGMQYFIKESVPDLEERRNLILNIRVSKRFIGWRIMEVEMTRL